MLAFSKVACDEGVSPNARVVASGLAVDGQDNLYTCTQSGVCILRKEVPLLEQYLQEDASKMSDGPSLINDGACTGYAVDLAWDSCLSDSEISTDELLPVVADLKLLKSGGLWVLDWAAHALRLVVAERLVTVAGGLKRAHRDGLARLRQNVDNEDAYACLENPLHALRMRHAPKVVIVELLDEDAGCRVRILDMKTWEVTTLATNLNPLPIVYRCYSRVETYDFPKHQMSASNILLCVTKDPDYIVLDVETGVASFDERFHPNHRLESGFHPIPSTIPIYMAPFRMCGIEAVLFAPDGRQLVSLEDSLDYAYIASANTLVRVGTDGIMSCTDALSQFSMNGHFKSCMTRLDSCDYSAMIDNDMLPGDLLLTHEDSGKTWLVHEYLLSATWRQLRMNHLSAAIRNSKLPLHLVDAFIRLLHHAPVFEDLERKDSLMLHWSMLFLARESGLPWPTLFPKFYSLMSKVSTKELCESFLRAWNDPTTPWSQEDFTLITAGFRIGHTCLETFQTLHASYSSESCREHAELLEFILECANIPSPLQVDSYTEPRGLLAEQIVWFPLRPSPHSQHTWTYSIEDLFVQAAQNPAEAEALRREDEQLEGEPIPRIPSDQLNALFHSMTLFVLTSAPVATLVHTITTFLRWNWFRRLMSVKWCEEARTRVVHLPDWVTPNMCTAILESVVAECQVQMTAVEVCTLQEFGHELELFTEEGLPIPPFERLQKYCENKLTKIVS